MAILHGWHTRSPATLIAARAIQGATAAIMAPAALSLVVTTFDEGAERNKALAVWGAIGGIGATAGLLVGGLVTDGLGWSWVFFINVPLGVGMLALSPVLLREGRDRGALVPSILPGQSPSPSRSSCSSTR